jgi:hypothetical protein
MTRHAVIDAYFLEHRAKILDLAAFLDRIERADPGCPGAGDDFRMAAVFRALAILTDGHAERARRVLETWSDPTLEPIASAAGMKGAYGAPPG